MHKRVLWSDGEGVTLDDLNSMQTHLQSLYHDFLWPGYRYEQGSQNLEKSYNAPPATYCFVPRAGGMFPYCVGPASTLVVGLKRGWVCMVNPNGPSVPDGDDPQMLAAFLDDNTSLFTLSTGDGSNPRIDLIQIKLTEIDDETQNRDFEDAVTRAKSTSTVDSKRRVQVDMSVKEGTPAANPSPPSPDSGYAEWARVRVDTAATSIDKDDIMDMRIPMRIEAQRIHPYTFGRPGTPQWAISTSARISIVTSGATDKCYMFPHTGVLAGRILGVWLNCAIVTAASTTFKLVRYDDNNGSLATQDIADLSTLMGFADATAKWHQKTGLVTGLASTNDNDERPIWTNFFGPQDDLSGNPGHGNFYRVGCSLDGPALTEVYEGGFFVATDLV